MPRIRAPRPSLNSRLASPETASQPLELNFSAASFFLEILQAPRHFRASIVQPMPNNGERTTSKPLTELEVEAIEMFINFLKLIGLPKSVGEIYGLLFVSPRPLTMDEIVSRLGISLGAASQGLKLLRGLGAAKAVYLPGTRRDYFTADLELSKFATVFIKEELRPRIERALERIHHLESLLPELPREDRQITRYRLDRLRHWLEKGEKMLPWTLRFLMK
jgi:HTH-type transcriptional regulator, glycine betaine synthesis regulator